MLLRVRRRGSSTEGSFDEFLKLEFYDGPTADLNLSVYEIGGPEEATRAYAEHCGENDLGFKTLAHFDVTGLCPGSIHSVPTGGRFRFTSDAHREVRFQGESALRTFTRALLESLPSRLVSVSKTSARAYARERFKAGDPEWTGLASVDPVWAKLLSSA